MDCDHINTILTEEGYECLICGRIVGRRWERRSTPVHYPGDYAHVRRCAECQRRPSNQSGWWR